MQFYTAEIADREAFEDTFFAADSRYEVLGVRFDAVVYKGWEDDAEES